MKQLFWVVLFAVMMLAAILALSHLTEKIVGGNVQTPPGFQKVIKVDDGDTIEVSSGHGKVRVRMMGVDTPETVDPRRPVQCFGKEASAYTKQSLRGQVVRLESDSLAGDKDKYGRLLRYVYLPDGTLYNQRLIAEGYAHEYTYQNQHYDRQTELKQAEREAQQKQRGLWSPTACNGNTKQPA